MANGGPSGNPTSEPDLRWKDVLDFEREVRASGRAKELAVRERFGMSAARYHQLLNRLIDRPEALAYDPVLVQRLRRLREARRRARFPGPGPLGLVGGARRGRVGGAR
ncbi:MAG TPA: DUF3263 domain-containing protein [Actinomycetota bacterium]|nr:DUF3263 domain-containing protein [Actinomycetota bacterium]